tara:strand:- start:1376 stop:1930 length:555 start_codon:yes stop_codon:yes gene_type:complete
MKMKRKIIPITLMLLLVIFVSSCGGSDVDKKKEEVAEKYDCENVDDCITKFNFEAARAFAGVEDDLMGDKQKAFKKVISAETNYWIDEGEYDRALSILAEGKVGIEDTPLGETEFNVMRFKLISSVVDKLLDQASYKEAKKWALKCDDLTVDGWSKSQDRNYDEKTNMKNTLLKKIKETEELMN